jgi:hypothetical protein
MNDDDSTMISSEITRVQSFWNLSCFRGYDSHDLVQSTFEDHNRHYAKNTFLDQVGKWEQMPIIRCLDVKRLNPRPFTHN